MAEQPTLSTADKLRDYADRADRGFVNHLEERMAAKCMRQAADELERLDRLAYLKIPIPRFLRGRRISTGNLWCGISNSTAHLNEVFCTAPKLFGAL